MWLRSLIETLTRLEESKGGDRVLTNNKMVSDLAAAIRDDALTNPSSFPQDFRRSVKRADDQTLTKWFIDQLDQIELRGYEGTQYSRDGINHEWIVRRYIAGSHNWEDISGTMDMNLSKWYYLKNRDLLDANHKDLWKFNSIRDVGYYMSRHYQQALVDYVAALRAAADKKFAKAVKLVDNEDYRIYMILNRAAACSYGLGSNWCTANTATGDHYDRYAGEGALYQLYPKEAEQVSKTKFGKKIEGSERYQFGPDRYYSFMDIADDPVLPKDVAEKFPYLYADLTNALKGKSSELQQYIDKLRQDPTLQDPNKTLVKPYAVSDEINKLQGFVQRGHMIDQPRPSKPEQIASAE